MKKAAVQLLKQRGRLLSKAELASAPTYRGILKVNEARYYDLNRAGDTAYLFSDVEQVPTHLVPFLRDAVMRHYADGEFLLYGIETISGQSHEQIWHCKVLPC